VSADDPSVAISLSGVGKRFTKYEDTPALISSVRHAFTRTKRSELWAVRDVDLEVTRGECLGVIGRNGSGKSTLLQMLCGVTGPSAGRVVVKGRVAPLISVGVGFHPELTGRENVYINATILGLTRKQIDERFDSIVEFSELESFIDTPVKFYSSGMFVRLGFSVAVQIDPDVLLIDEVLAVGDLGFQLKCFERLNQVRESGATVVFVTHNLNLIRRLCDRAIVMNQGHAVFEGDPSAAVGKFHDLLHDTDTAESDLGWAVHRTGFASIAVSALTNERGEETSSFGEGEDLSVRVQVEAIQDVRDAFVALTVYSDDGTLVYSESTFGSTPWSLLRAGDVREMDAKVRLTLPTGSYSVLASLHQRPDEKARKQIQLGVTPERFFHVSGRSLVRGIADLGGRFSFPSAGPTRKP
jgi:ABC-type polysaccharide/polyol phosphate transport system ATPase subunit